MSLSSSSLSLSSRRDWPSPLAVSLAMVSCHRYHPRYRGPLPVRPVPPRAAMARYRPRPASSRAATASSCPGAVTTYGPMRRRRLLAPRPPPVHARSRPHALSLAADPCPTQPAASFHCAPGPHVASASNHTAGEEAMAAHEAAEGKTVFYIGF